MSNPFDTGYYSIAELRCFPFPRVDENSAISRNCTIFCLENISIGDNVRVDSDTTIVAKAGYLRLGSHDHIGIGCVLGARGRIEMDDSSSLSHGATGGNPIRKVGPRERDLLHYEQRLATAPSWAPKPPLDSCYH